MGVQTTKALASKLEAEAGPGAAQVFCDEFAKWHASRNHLFFGKDGAYAAPKVGMEQYKLMHVHLIPGKSQAEIDHWVKLYKLGRNPQHRTSDHVLVYVGDDKGNFLLIDILDEPGAHVVAQMKSARDKETMEGFAAVAEAFRHDGTIEV